jgi:hypothetical protein
MDDALIPVGAHDEHAVDRGVPRPDTEAEEDPQEAVETSSALGERQEVNQEDDDSVLALDSVASRDREALRRIAEKIDEEKAPVLSEFNATTWRMFQLEYKDYKENGGLKTMAKCIARPLQAQLQWELPQRFRRMLFEKVPDEVLIDSLSDQFTSRTVTQLLNELSRVSMRSTGNGMKKDVVNYFIKLDEVKLQFENINLNEELYCEQIIRGLTPTLDFKQEVRNEFKQRGIRRADDLQTLILELARKLEQEYRPREQPDRSSPGGAGQKKGTTNMQPARPFSQNPDKTKPSERSPSSAATAAAGNQVGGIRCFNCQGPHLVKDCTKRRNESVISANAATYEESKKKRQQLQHVRALKTGPPSSEVKMVGLDELHVSAKLPNASAVVDSAHVKSRIVLLDEPAVAHIDSGACVSLVKPALAERLLNAGCSSRRVTKQICGFDGQARFVSSQLMGVELMIKGQTGPVLLKIDPYVTEIMDDMIVDKFTAMGAGILEIKVSPEQIIPHTASSQAGCFCCGAVYDPQPELRPSTAATEVTTKTLANTIGPDVTHDRML